MTVPPLRVAMTSLGQGILLRLRHGIKAWPHPWRLFFLTCQATSHKSFSLLASTPVGASDRTVTEASLPSVLLGLHPTF